MPRRNKSKGKKQVKKLRKRRPKRDHPSFKNETGNTYGTWFVVARSTVTCRGSNNVYWICKCTICSRLRDIRGDNLRRNAKNPRLELECYCKKTNTYDFLKKKKKKLQVASWAKEIAHVAVRRRNTEGY